MSNTQELLNEARDLIKKIKAKIDESNQNRNT